MQRVATSPEMAERFLQTIADIDVTELLPKVKTPTLVLHARGDLRAPFAFAQEIAAAIPGAKLISLESSNHLIMPDEPSNRVMFDAISDFLGEKRIRGSLPGTTTLTVRLETKAKAIEQSWIIKMVIVLAALTGCFLFALEMWKLWKPH